KYITLSVVSGQPSVVDAGGGLHPLPSLESPCPPQPWRRRIWSRPFRPPARERTKGLPQTTRTRAKTSVYGHCTVTSRKGTVAYGNQYVLFPKQPNTWSKSASRPGHSLLTLLPSHSVSIRLNPGSIRVKKCCGCQNRVLPGGPLAGQSRSIALNRTQPPPNRS